MDTLSATQKHSIEIPSDDRTLQEIMWENAVRSSKSTVMRKTSSEWFWDNSVWFLAAVLILFGACLVYRFPEPYLRHSLGEALLIAGFLTATVDPYLKRRMQKEVAESMFRHVLGFELPEDIQDTLVEFLRSNKSYRKNVDIEATIVSNSTESVELTLAIRSEVISVATTEYQQHISFEESEKGKVLEASVISRSHENYSYAKSEKDIILKDHDTEAMVKYWNGNKIPLKRDDTLEAFIRFSVTKPSTGFFTLNFGASVIKPKLRLNQHPDFEFTASKSEHDQQNGNEYIYNKVFVAADHIQMRWKPKPSVSQK
jgi:hypothetical protein